MSPPSLPEGERVGPRAAATERVYRLEELARLLQAQLAGPGELEIRGVGGVDDVREGEITLAASGKYLGKAEESPAAAVILARGLNSRKPALISDNPKAAFGIALGLFEDREQPPEGVHPTAVVAKSATLGQGVAVGPYCVIGEDVVLEGKAAVHAHCVIGRRCRVGADTILFPRVTLYEGAVIGARCRIHSGAVIGADGFGYAAAQGRLLRIPQVGSVVIGDEVEIGANACIDRATTGATRVGNGTKIDNLVQVGHNVTIGRNCIICGQVGLAGSVTIGDGVTLAGQAGVADHLSIGEGATIGGGSGVMHDLPGGHAYSGLPAQPHRQHLRLLSALRRLPDLMDELRGRGGRNSNSG